MNDEQRAALTELEDSMDPQTRELYSLIRDYTAYLLSEVPRSQAAGATNNDWQPVQVRTLFGVEVQYHAQNDPRVCKPFGIHTRVDIRPVDRSKKRSRYYAEIQVHWASTTAGPEMASTVAEALARASAYGVWARAAFHDLTWTQAVVKRVASIIREHGLLLGTDVAYLND